MRKIFLLSVINIMMLCVVIAGVSLYFINEFEYEWLVLILLGFLCVISLIPFKVKLNTIQPDLIFGFIDNGILAILSIVGGHFAGITGAILGGIVGNAITDGIAGIFEGIWAENLRLNTISEERTMLKSAVGKMAGCLFGAGAALMLANLF